MIWSAPPNVWATKYAGEPYHLGVGARALGRGGAFVAARPDASSAFWNIASLSSINRIEVLAQHAEAFGSLLNHDFISVAIPSRTESGWAFGAYGTYLGGGGGKGAQRPFGIHCAAPIQQIAVAAQGHFARKGVNVAQQQNFARAAALNPHGVAGFVNLGDADCGVRVTLRSAGGDLLAPQRAHERRQRGAEGGRQAGQADPLEHGAAGNPAVELAHRGLLGSVRAPRPFRGAQPVDYAGAPAPVAPPSSSERPRPRVSPVACT